MEVFEVHSTNDERSSSVKAICDSLETALEFSKDVYDWFSPHSVYEGLMKEYKRTGKYDWHIRKVEVLTMDDVSISTKHISRKDCEKLMEKVKNNNPKAYKAYKERLIYLIQNDIYND